MKYKVGDKVRIKSLDWYNENKDKNGNIVFSSKVHQFSWNVNVRTMFTKDMVKFCGKVVTIESVWTVNYSIVEGTYRYYFTDEMIEGLAEESDDFEKMCMESEKRYEEEYSTGEYCHEQSFKWGFQEGYNYSHENDKLEISLKDGHQFVDENGNVINATKIVLEKKKKEYPKTYEECAGRIMRVELWNTLWGEDATEYEEQTEDLIDAFIRLKVCRDAYWKIAGEEMGLGKPWEPDWAMYSGLKHCIIYSNNEIKWRCKSFVTEAKILAFPTAKMRDAFKENFKELIEQCKELL